SAGTNQLGQVTNAPYFVLLTNVPPGTYTFTAIAVDNLGAMGTSAPVTVTVAARLPLTVISAIHLNLQTGLFDETVRVFNPTTSVLDAIRIYISNLTSETVVWNASG